MMEAVSLTAVADQQIESARTSSAGRSVHAIHGGRGTAMRQLVVALLAGRMLGEHDNPGEATLQVLTGQVRLDAGDDSWHAGAGEYLVVPPMRHDLAAIEDSVVVLSTVTTAGE